MVMVKYFLEGFTEAFNALEIEKVMFLILLIIFVAAFNLII